MVGFQRILLRMIPFILILCFVAYGIEVLNALSPQHLNNITYLKEVIIYDTTDPTIELYRYYEYDFAKYLKNITIQPFLTVLNIQSNFSTFNDLKQIIDDLAADGYSAADILKVIANIIIALANAAITIVNVILIPLRFISAIIIVSLSITGINTDVQTNTNPVNQALWYAINNPIIPTISYWQ